MTYIVFKRILRSSLLGELLIGCVTLARSNTLFGRSYVSILARVQLEVLFICKDLLSCLLCLLGERCKLEFLLLFVGHFDDISFNHHLFKLLGVLELKVSLHERELHKGFVLS